MYTYINISLYALLLIDSIRLQKREVNNVNDKQIFRYFHQPDKQQLCY